jgi:hypothetical protein
VRTSEAGIYGFGFPQRLEIGIGVLPKREEFIIIVKRCGCVAFHLLHESHPQACEDANYASRD